MKLDDIDFRSWHNLMLALIAALCFSAPRPALAALTLSATENNVPVYTGPSERYRLLTLLNAKTEIKAENKIVITKTGRFYRVLVNIGENTKAVGFIPLSAPIRVGGEDEDEDEISKYGAVALINKGVQVTFGNYQNDQSMWSLGYQHYLSPGFYAKGMLGQWTTQISNASLVAGEIGNDSLLTGSVSGFVSYALGLAQAESENSLFAGSSKLSLFMNATIGLRYNIEGAASVAIAGSQAALYNQNNSMLATGIQASIEVGI